MLGTMAGLWISLAIVVFGGLVVAGVVAGSSEKSTVEKHSILYFDLSGTVSERYEPQSLMQAIQSVENTTPTLDQMLNALSMAAHDSKIDALYLNCGGSSMGMASRQELIEAIKDFKVNSGKPVYAYGDQAYLQGDYLIASLADSIYLNPMGTVDIHGVGASVPFFKNALDKLGIKVQVLKVGTFKSAVEPYILTSMSEPARHQMQQYCDSLWAYARGVVAENRAVENDSIIAWASNLVSTRPSESFVELGLVDGLRYRRQVENILRELTGTEEGHDLPLVTPVDYLAGKELLTSLTSNSKSHVAVLYTFGDIVDTGDEGIVGPKVVDQVVELADNEKVKALVLRVNSGGGSAFASEQIWEALEYFKSKGKPFYVSMGDYAASGGYYISCGADKIYADETTITGSIGVFGMIPELSGLVSDKLGVDFSTVETNPNAAGVSYMQPMTPQQHTAMQRGVDDIYARFTGRVAIGRNMDVDSVRAIAEGRVWIGSCALQLGLVDELGSLADCIDAITAEVNLDVTDVVAYPKVEEDPWVALVREAGKKASIKSDLLRASGLEGLDFETIEQIRTIRRIKDMNPIQARMERVIIN